MDSKNKKMAIALVIVIIVIVAGIALAIQLQPPSQSASDEMILTIGDFSSPGWNLQDRQPASSLFWENITCSTYSVLKNETEYVHIEIVVFNEAQDAHSWYKQDVSSFLLTVGQNITGTTMIGDACTLVNRTDNLGEYELRMVRSNVWADISVHTISPIYWSSWQELYPIWKYDATVYIAQLQLYKIDQCLAQHPGANE
jgi:hypothetical protein